MKTLLVTTGLVLLVLVVAPTPAAWACEHCLGTGGANGPTVRALVLSMAALFSMICFVGVGVGAFFVRAARRSKELAAGDMEVKAR